MNLRKNAQLALEYPIRFLFGDDIFISYSRADGITYAEGLASELARRGFSCRVDLWETLPGADLPPSLKRALRWSKLLVLLATNGAIQSPHVGFEVTEFLVTSGVVVPIAFGQPIDQASWYPQILGLPVTNEPQPDALTTGQPSLPVLSRIENSIKFTRRNRRIRDTAAVALVILAISTALSIVAGWNAARATKEAARQQQATKLEDEGTGVLRQFQSGTGELESLESAIRTGRQLLSLAGPGTAWQDYPAISPVAALNTILANIHEKNRVSANGFGLVSLTMSQDGRQFAFIRSEDKYVNGKGSLWVWDIAGRPIWHCALPDTGVNDIEFDRTNAGIVVKKFTRGYEFWDPACSASPVEPSHSIMIDRRRGLYTQAGPDDASVQVVNSAGEEIVTIPQPPAGTSRIRVQPSGKLVLSVEPNSIDIWRGQAWERFFDAGAEHIEDAQFISNGEFVVVELHGGSFRALNLSGTVVENWHTPDSQHELWLSPVEPKVVTAGEGLIRIWDIGGALQNQFAVPAQVTDVQFINGGSQLMVVAFDTVRFVNLNGQPLFQLSGHQGMIRKVLLTPDGKSAISSGSDGTLRIWDLSSDLARQLSASSMRIQELSASSMRIQELAFIEQGKLLTVASDGTVAVWGDASNPVRQWKADEPISRAQISSDGSRIALTHDGRVELRTVDGQTIPSGDPMADGRSVTILQLAFSPDGTAIALSRAGGSIQIQNVASGKRVTQPTQGWAYGLAFDSSSAKLGVALSSGTVVLFNRDGQSVWQADTRQGQLMDIAFSGDGRYMATAGADGAVALWTTSGELIERIFGHSARILTVRFSPDSQLIATAGEDQFVRLWDLKGRQIAAFSAPVQAATGEAQGGGFIGPPLKFNAGGSLLALGSHDGSVRVWHVDKLDQLLKRGDQRLAAYRATAALKN